MMTVGVWLTLDAVLDNVISDQIQSGDADLHVVERSTDLRQRGWALNKTHPLRGQGPVGWPPLEAPFPIALDGAELTFLLGAVEADIRVTEDLLAREVMRDAWGPAVDSSSGRSQVQREQEASAVVLKRAREVLVQMLRA